MAKDKDKKKKSASAGAKADANASVTSNPRLVEAFKQYEESKQETKSRLVTLGTICQEEQCTRAEQVASYMEAFGCERSTAESQISRITKILNDSETLEALRSGEIDLKTAKERAVKKQKNPSAKKKAENIEKRYTKAISQVVACAKEGAYDRSSVLNTIKSALSKAGVK